MTARISSPNIATCSSGLPPAGRRIGLRVRLTDGFCGARRLRTASLVAARPRERDASASRIWSRHDAARLAQTRAA